MSLENIGKILKEARLSKNIDLKEVHEHIKVGIHILKAIEEGDEKSLPHPIYAKSFIQAYAKFLDLDWKKIGEEYADLYKFDNKIDKLDKLPTTIEDNKKYYLQIGFYLSIIALVMVIILFFSFFSKKRNSIKESAVYNNSSQINGSTPQENVLEEQSSNINETLSLAEQNNTLQENMNKNNSNINETQNIAEKSFSISTQKVEVVAKDQCWVQAKLDNNKTQEYYLYPNDKITIKFNNNLELKLGNAGGVKVYFNNKEISLSAEKKEVKILHFPLNNQ
ncbi:helix-turn-helix domain-containing protein [Desulfonauticus submarinus]